MRCRAIRVTAEIHAGSTVVSNGSPGTPGVGQSSSTRPSRSLKWNPSPAKMVIGMSGGSRVQGTVAAACRRSGVTGSGTPACSATAAAHGPAALITISAAIRPRVVSTDTIRPAESRTSPVTVEPHSIRTPCRDPPAR